MQKEMDTEDYIGQPTVMSNRYDGGYEGPKKNSTAKKYHTRNLKKLPRQSVTQRHASPDAKSSNGPSYSREYGRDNPNTPSQVLSFPQESFPQAPPRSSSQRTQDWAQSTSPQFHDYHPQTQKAARIHDNPPGPPRNYASQQSVPVNYSQQPPYSSYYGYENRPPSQSEDPQISRGDVNRKETTVEKSLPPFGYPPIQASLVRKSATSEIKVGDGKRISDLLAALEQVDREQCDRQEFTNLRTQLYSEALMYNQEVHPPTLTVVRGVRNTVSQFESIKTVDEFIRLSDSLLHSCSLYQPTARKLVHSHAYVLGNLKRLENSIQDNQRGLLQEARDIQDDADKNAKSARRIARARFVTFLIPPLHDKVGKEVRRKEKLVEDQKADVKTLKMAVESIKTLRKAHEQLYKTIETLAKSLNSMKEELYQVIMDGRTAASPETHREFAERVFNKFKSSISKVTDECNVFLETELRYPQTMTTIRARDYLKEDYKEDWKQGLKIVESESGATDVYDY
jgi:hypothetical protein